MAGALSQAPILQVVAGTKNLELGGGTKKDWRANRGGGSFVNLNSSYSSSVAPAGPSSSSGYSLHKLAGLRRSAVVDAPNRRCCREPHSSVSAAVGGRGSSGVAVVAEFGEKAAELTISPLEEEAAGSINGHENLPTTPNFETSRNLSRDEDVQSKSFPGVQKYSSSKTFNSAVDSYRPGAGRSSEVATSSAFRPGPIPSSVASKSKGKIVFVDRWVPPGSKANHVKQVMERLENVVPTDAGVKTAMEDWETTIASRDITSILANLRWKTAQAFFNWLQSQGYELNLVVYNVLLGRFRAGRVWNVAENFAQTMVKAGIQLDNYTYSTLISCALQCNLPKEALKWFDKMHEAGCVPDEVTYSTMALVYSRLGRFNDAVELYERLKETGWKPDKISFGTMVNVYSRGGNYFKASAVIKEMQSAGFQPEAVVFNTLIKFFAREGKTGQAKRVYLDMEKAGVKPTEYTLSLMIDVHGRGGETKEAFQLFSRMKEEKLPLDVVVYNSLLKMCAEQRLVGEAESLLAGMVGRGINPDVITYKSMINLYAKEGRIQDAEKFATRMVEAGYTLDVVVYSCLIKACGSSKDFKKAATFLTQMLADGCTVDDKCCGVLLSLMSRCETIEDRALIVECLRKAKPVLSEIVDVLLEEDLKLDVLEELVQKLLAESELDSHRPFCNALVDLCWNLEKDRAEQLLSLADSLNVYPGGLRSQTKQLWILHLRSLSFNAAECGLYAWIHYLRDQVKRGKELPETLVIETGVGRIKGDVNRLYDVILTKLKDMGVPFEPSQDRTDWIVAAGSATKEWFSASVDVQSQSPAAED